MKYISFSTSYFQALARSIFLSIMNDLNVSNADIRLTVFRVNQIERARIYGQELIYRLPTITQIYSLDIDWIGMINSEYTEYNKTPRTNIEGVENLVKKFFSQPWIHFLKVHFD